MSNAERQIGTDRRWQQILKKMLRIREPFVKVGVLASQGGDDTDESGVTVLQVAVIHEFGAPAANIPQRSFIRSTVDDRDAQLRAMIRKLLNRVVERRLSATKALDILGLWLASEIKKQIVSGIDPPLKQATVAAKGSTTPLVDTGRLLNSITHEVES